MEQRVYEERLPITPELLYELGKIFVAAAEWKTALDEVVPIIQSHLYFDYVLVYHVDIHDQISLLYVKANNQLVNRESEIDWELLLHTKNIKTEQGVINQTSQEDGVREMVYVSVPLIYEQGKPLDFMVFARLSEKEFHKSEIEFVEYIALQVARIIECQVLKLEQTLIEKQRRNNQLKEDFITHVTHELRNPLGCIKGYTTTLLRPDIEWEQNVRQEFLKIIDQETDYLNEIIEDMLDASRLQSGQLEFKKQRIEVNQILEGFMTEAAPLYPELNIIVNKDVDVVFLLGDGKQLKKVFRKLLNNVIKYAPGADITINLGIRDNIVDITFADNGPGIPEEYLPRLFDLFIRLPNKAPNVRGSGLGLYISKKIIEAHEGKIEVKSVLGEGTEFNLQIPLFQ